MGLGGWVVDDVAGIAGIGFIKVVVVVVVVGQPLRL